MSARAGRKTADGNRWKKIEAEADRLAEIFDSRDPEVLLEAVLVLRKAAMILEQRCRRLAGGLWFSGQG
jgi:hypothetical protein